RGSIGSGLANREPGVDPLIAKEAGGQIIATGSYRFHNKVNNALILPYLMRAILDQKILKISLGILLATAKAIADRVTKKELHYNRIIPDVGDKRLQKNIALALKKFYKK